MNKFFKISIVFTFIMCFYLCISNADTTNLYNQLSNTDSSNTTIADEETDEEDFDELSEENNVYSTRSSSSDAINSSTRVNTLSSIPEANLGLNNILCIILIAIGILIILLAIAILIRLK